MIRLGDGPKGLAMTTDVNERYCEADPVEGGRQAVVEAWRNLIAAGQAASRSPTTSISAIPRSRKRWASSSAAFAVSAEAARVSGLPRRLQGNVSALQRDDGRGHPADARDRRRWGCSRDVTTAASIGFKQAGEEILLIGGAPSWLGCSSFAAVCLGREDGAPPPVDLSVERRNGEFVSRLIVAGRVTAVHDVSDGGVAVALAEMAMAAQDRRTGGDAGADPLAGLAVRRGPGALSDRSRPRPTRRRASSRRRDKPGFPRSGSASPAERR